MLPKQTALFESGKDGYHTYRIPAILVSNLGTTLAFCEGRRNSSSDTGDIDTVLKRSFDNGKTWEPMQIIADDGHNTMGNPCPVVDRTTGDIWLPLTRNLGEDNQGHICNRTGKGTRTVWVTGSTDDGATWSEPREITETTKLPDWTWYSTGPGVSIQSESGRLIVPCNHALEDSKEYYSNMIFSDDHGETWELGGVLSDERTTECQLVELQDGTLLLDIRKYPCHEGLRGTSRSSDGGQTWSRITHNEDLIGPGCQASILRPGKREGHPEDLLLFSNPASDKREKMTVRLSNDGGKTWPAARLLHPGPSAYSCLAVMPDRSIACLYEHGDEHLYERIMFAQFDLQWLVNSSDN